LHGTGLPPARVEEVSDRVFAYIQPDGTWFINNTGFLVAAGGVTSIDATSTERRTRAYLDAIAQVTGGKPVRTLINTHHHGDHTHGNFLFRGATIVAHGRGRRSSPPGCRTTRASSLTSTGAASRSRRRSSPTTTT
jgi:cyclase